MANERHLWDESFESAEDLSAKQFFCVELDSTGKISLADASTDDVIGILQNKPKSGQAATVRLLGISKGVSDGSGTAIAVGDWVGPDSNGKLVKKSTDDNVVVGRALNGSTADGTIISVLMVKPGRFRTAT